MLSSLRRGGGKFWSASDLWSRSFTFSPVPLFFQSVEQAPKDPILGITENFLADGNPKKMNLGVVRSVTALWTGERSVMPYRVPIEMMMASQWCSNVSERLRSVWLDSTTWSKTSHKSDLLIVGVLRYLPIGGLKEFCHLSAELAYGADASVIKEKRVASVQTLSGTGLSDLDPDLLR